MWKNKSVVAVIPARSGSKGIPHKNLQLLGEKPLIAWSIEFALSCPEIDYVFVSTDDDNIANEAIKFGAKVPFLRPKELASDTARTDSAVSHALLELNKLNLNFDIVILLQPTQPFRIHKDLVKALELHSNQHQMGVLSVSKVEEHPILMRSFTENGMLKNLLNSTSTVRRQDFEEFFKVNGSFYVNKRSEYKIGIPLSLNDNPVGFIMPKKRSIDIDTIEDLEFARFRLAQNPDFFKD